MHISTDSWILNTNTVICVYLRVSSSRGQQRDTHRSRSRFRDWMVVRVPLLRLPVHFSVSTVEGFFHLLHGEGTNCRTSWSSSVPLETNKQQQLWLRIGQSGPLFDHVSQLNSNRVKNNDFKKDLRKVRIWKILQIKVRTFHGVLSFLSDSGLFSKILNKKIIRLNS